jgi:hypothetical protein
MTRVTAGLAGIGFVLLSAVAWGQDRPARSAVELSGGASWLGEQPAGSAQATLTENPSGNRFIFFNTTSRLESAFGWSVRGAVRVYGPFYVEGAFERTSPTLSTTINADAESATGTPTADLARSVLSGSVRLDLEKLAFDQRKAVPFVLAGGGRLSVSQGGFEDTGSEIHTGVGLRHRTFNRAKGPVKAIGLRLEGLLAWHKGGIDFEGEGGRTLGQADLSLVLSF